MQPIEQQADARADFLKQICFLPRCQGGSWIQLGTWCAGSTADGDGGGEVGG